MVLHVEGALVVEEVAVHLEEEELTMISQVVLQYMIKHLPREAWVAITITPILRPIRIRSIRTVVLRISSVTQIPRVDMNRAMGTEISKVR
jgi:hypothetical protein